MEVDAGIIAFVTEWNCVIHLADRLGFFVGVLKETEWNRVVHLMGSLDVFDEGFKVSRKHCVFLKSKVPG
jgi:hypothetical protein